MSSSGANYLSPVSVLSVGAVTPLGRNLGEIALKLEAAPAAAGKVLRVSDEIFSDAGINKRMRRADRFSRMAAVAALDAWAGAGAMCANVSMERIGMIVASGFGPHCRGFRFLDGIIDCGDSAASPTDFSHSVHGAASAYIAELLELRGPSLATTDFEIGFEQSVFLAQSWLNDGVCDRVLVGAVEELGEVMIHCIARMLDGSRFYLPSEGAVFFMLGPAEVQGMARIDAGARLQRVDFLALEEPALPGIGMEKPPVAGQTTTFSPYFGHTTSSSAFAMLGGLLALQSQKPLGRAIGASAGEAPKRSILRNAATFRTTGNQPAAMLLLSGNEL